MASVTQCDVCSNVVKHEQSKYIEIYSVKKDDSTGLLLHKREVCPDCYTKVCAVLGLEAKQ